MLRMTQQEFQNAYLGGYAAIDKNGKKFFQLRSSDEPQEVEIVSVSPYFCKKCNTYHKEKCTNDIEFV